MTRSSTVRASLLLALALVVPACGGGSSGGGAAPTGPAVVVTLTGPSATTELGGATTITVVLNTLPANDVTIDYRSSDTSEGTVDGTGTLTFTSANGTTPQTITVTGQNDAITDVATAYVIEIDPAASLDANYNGLDGTDVNLTNTDDEVTAISVSITTLGDIVEGGATQQFTVSLGSTPTAAVTIPITVVTGAGDATVFSPGMGGAATSINLVLDAGNLSRVVTVAAVNDGLIEAPEGPYTITTGDPTSTDAAYDAFVDGDVADLTGGMILDNDSASIIVTPTTASAGLTLQTTELGSTDTFQVRLGAPVADQVTVTITGLVGAEGSLSTTTVVFDSTNGTTFQTVTVTGVDDATADPDVEYTLTLTASNTGTDSADDVFDLLTATVVVTNFDMDGVTLPVGGTPSTPPTATPGVPLGGAGAFSTFRLDHPSVITNSFSGDAFEMFFRGRNSGGIKFDGIGRSVSAAPASGWNHNIGPVFSANDTPGSWMRRAVGRPCVIRADLDQDGGAVTADTYIMFYAGAQGGEAYNGIGFATSTDGLNWTAADEVNPSFAATGVAGDWDEAVVDSPSVILVGTEFRMWYTGYSVLGGVPRIGYATAPLVGGVPGAWTRQNLLLNVALQVGGANSFDADGVSDPTVVLDGATYRMWYTATDAARGRTTIGYADSILPGDFTAGKFPVPVIKPHATADAPWGDANLFAPAAAARVGGGFHLWYSGTGSGGAGIGYIEMQ